MRHLVIGFIVLSTTAGSAFSETKEPPKKLSVDLGSGVKMEMVLVPAGEFMMGSGESAEETTAFFKKNYGMDFLAADLFKAGYPQHPVQITKPFYLGAYHVTRGQFHQFVTDSGYKTEAEKGEQPGPAAGTPRKIHSTSTRITLGGTRVSSRPMSTRWSTLPGTTQWRSVSG